MPDLELITTQLLARFQLISQWVFNDFIFLLFSNAWSKSCFWMLTIPSGNAELLQPWFLVILMIISRIEIHFSNGLWCEGVSFLILLHAHGPFSAVVFLTDTQFYFLASRAQFCSSFLVLKVSLFSISEHY